MSAALIEAIAARRIAGKSYEQIARRLGVPPDVVRYQCWKLDLPSPRFRVQRRPEVYLRAGAPVRAFTDAEDARILKLAAQGICVAHIARALGRRRTPVWRRLIRLRRQAAEVAQQTREAA
jgi:transposase-like protein